jgi:hypothetical protein
MSEIQLQAKCFQWAWNTYPQLRDGALFAVPNGGKRGVIEAQQLKASGTVAGIEDLILTWPSLDGIPRIYGIEMKTKDGVLSKEQKKIHKRHRELGWYVFERVETLEEFQDIINNILTHKTFDLPF